MANKNTCFDEIARLQVEQEQRKQELIDEQDDEMKALISLDITLKQMDIDSYYKLANEDCQQSEI